MKYKTEVTKSKYDIISKMNKDIQAIFKKKSCKDETNNIQNIINTL